jgi:hypothetical protein
MQTKDRDNKNQMVLDGYWSSHRISNGIHNRPFILFFNDSIISFLTPENYGKYVIKNGELFFKNPSDNKTMTFKLIEYDGTKLKLKIADSTTKETIKELGGFTNSDLLHFQGKRIPDLNTLCFYKLKKQNKKTFSKITFRCGPCGSKCSVFYLKINQTGEVIYYGTKGKQNMNGYKGIMSNTEIINLKNTINLLSINQIIPKYKAPWTDDQECNLKIDFSDGTSLETAVYGFNDEPIELRAVMYKLMTLSKLLELKPEQNVDPYSFSELGEPFISPVLE